MKEYLLTGLFLKRQFISGNFRSTTIITVRLLLKHTIIISA